MLIAPHHETMHQTVISIQCGEIIHAIVPLARAANGCEAAQ